jgi:hypothetical protein
MKKSRGSNFGLSLVILVDFSIAILDCCETGRITGCLEMSTVEVRYLACQAMTQWALFIFKGENVSMAALIFNNKGHYRLTMHGRSLPLLKPYDCNLSIFQKDTCNILK